MSAEALYSGVLNSRSRRDLRLDIGEGRPLFERSPRWLPAHGTGQMKVFARNRVNAVVAVYRLDQVLQDASALSNTVKDRSKTDPLANVF